MKNRYGVAYNFEHIIQNQYKFVMDEEGLRYCRFGGQEGQDELDMNNLGFFDPAGGPFIQVGSKIYYDEVAEAENGDGPWKVTHIRSTEDGIFVEVE